MSQRTCCFHFLQQTLSAVFVAWVGQRFKLPSWLNKYLISTMFLLSSVYSRGKWALSPLQSHFQNARGPGFPAVPDSVFVPTEYHKLCGLKSRNVFSHDGGGQRSEVQWAAGWVLSRELRGRGCSSVPASGRCWRSLMLWDHGILPSVCAFVFTPTSPCVAVSLFCFLQGHQSLDEGHPPLYSNQI